MQFWVVEWLRLPGWVWVVLMGLWFGEFGGFWVVWADLWDLWV